MHKKLLASFTAYLSLAGCAVPQSGDFEAVPAANIPFGLDSAQTTLPSPTMTAPSQSQDPAGTEYVLIDLYFIRNSFVVKVQREVAIPVDATIAIEALSKGLDTDPQLAGLRTALPSTFEASVEVDRGVANVNASRAFLNSLSAVDQRLAIAQIVLTLTSQPGIGQVLVSVDGKPIAVPRGRGDLISAGNRVTFDDYANLIATN
jgi:spore germination protein GerM